MTIITIAIQSALAALQTWSHFRLAHITINNINGDAGRSFVIYIVWAWLYFKSLMIQWWIGFIGQMGFHSGFCSAKPDSFQREIWLPFCQYSFRVWKSYTSFTAIRPFVMPCIANTCWRRSVPSSFPSSLSYVADMRPIDSRLSCLSHWASMLWGTFKLKFMISGSPA